MFQWMSRMIMVAAVLLPFTGYAGDSRGIDLKKFQFNDSEDTAFRMNQPYGEKWDTRQVSTSSLDACEKMASSIDSLSATGLAFHSSCKKRRNFIGVTVGYNLQVGAELEQGKSLKISATPSAECESQANGRRDGKNWREPLLIRKVENSYYTFDPYMNERTGNPWDDLFGLQYVFDKITQDKGIEVQLECVYDGKWMLTGTVSAN
jgi:hypothetical protein